MASKRRQRRARERAKRAAEQERVVQWLVYNLPLGLSDRVESKATPRPR